MRFVGLSYLLSATLLAGSAAAQTTEIARTTESAKHNPSDAGAQTALGIAYLRAGRYADAQRQLEKAEALSKGDPAAVTRVAEVAIAQGDYKRARNVCMKLFREVAQPAPLARVCMARAYLAWNRSERAFEELEAALASDPQSTEAQLVLGHAHRIRNQVSEAEAAYLAAARNPALAAEAELGLGQLFVAAGRRAEAVSVLRSALIREPNWPEVQLQLGSLLGSSSEAQQLLSAALAGRPGWSDAARALGDARREANDLAGGEAAYRQAIAADPELAAAYTGLGQALLGQGRVGDAEVALRKSISLVANNARATLALGEVLVQKQLLEEAIETFRHAADLDPRDPTGLLRAAEVLTSQKRPTLAAGFLDRLLSAHPQHARGLALYGDLMRARGDRVSAKQYYERALNAGGELDRSKVQQAMQSL